MTEAPRPLILLTNDDGVAAPGIRGGARGAGGDRRGAGGGARSGAERGLALDLARPPAARRRARRRTSSRSTARRSTASTWRSCTSCRGGRRWWSRGSTTGSTSGRTSSIRGRSRARSRGRCAACRRWRCRSSGGGRRTSRTRPAFGAALAAEIIRRGRQGAAGRVAAEREHAGRGRFDGYRVTFLGRRVYRDQVEVRQDLRGRAYYWIGGPEENATDLPGSDLSAVRDGLASVTPLGLDLTHARAHRRARRLAGGEIRARGDRTR